MQNTQRKEVQDEKNESSLLVHILQCKLEK